MIEKSESNQLSLATAPILGQAPRIDDFSRAIWYTIEPMFPSPFKDSACPVV
ncbi:MAG: hypothetical protein GY792_03160 [Gammaproteobacteria bacterium]|nr:hypothetical protein [Gammaproteobacteria bacterium]